MLPHPAEEKSAPVAFPLNRKRIEKKFLQDGFIRGDFALRCSAIASIAAHPKE